MRFLWDILHNIKLVNINYCQTNIILELRSVSISLRIVQQNSVYFTIDFHFTQYHCYFQKRCRILIKIRDKAS